MNTLMVQTELGALPFSWSVCRMGDCLVKAPSYGINAPAVPRTDKLPAYVRITDIDDDGRLASAQLPSVDNPHSVQYELSVGDIVLARTGASVGKSWLYDGSVKPLVYAGFLIKVTPNQQRLMPSFLAAYLTTGTYWNWVNQTSMRSGQPGINGVEYSQLLVPVPPLPEQRAIATALSDVDALIAGLERLIAKKRDIKQAAMQQLLNGQTRLPGFSGEWVTKLLPDLADIRSGGTPSTSDAAAWDGDIPWCTPTDITALAGRKYLTQTARRITEHGLRQSSAEVIPAGSIVMTSRATIGECAINAAPMTTNQGFKNFVPFVSVDTEFLYYLLVTQKAGFIGLCSGSTFLEIGKTQLRGFAVHLPATKAEQTAIATVLSDMDADLAALESRLAKTRAIKQGMMQELLTGRTRLV